MVNAGLNERAGVKVDGEVGAAGHPFAKPVNGKGGLSTALCTGYHMFG